MNSRSLRPHVVCACALAVLCASALTAPVASQNAEKSLIVSAVDASGRPVAGLTKDDFAVREDGADREIIDVRPATGPLQVVLLADTTAGADRYIQSIRTGLKSFVQEILAGNAESKVALWEFGRTPQRITNFTSDAAALEKEIGRLSSRPQAGSALLDALESTANALANAPTPRRAIVALSIEPSDEHSEQQPQKINDALMRSRAQVWTLSVREGAQQNSQRDALLSSLVRNAGGVREFTLVDTAIEQHLRRYAAALTAQYQLTYKRPSGTAKVVQTGIRRDGVRVIAGLGAPK